MEAALPRAAAARALALAVIATASGASPFEGLHELDGVTTSNDEWGIWIAWEASSYRLKFPRRPPLARGPGGTRDLRAYLATSCRADGRPEGFSGPRAIRAELVLPLHPDEPNVPSFFNPRYWATALLAGELERTPVQVAFDGAPAAPAELVRKRIDYSIARPSPTVQVNPAEALASIASGNAAEVAAEGRDTRLSLRFGPDPATSRAATLMALHCEEGTATPKPSPPHKR